MNRNFIQRFFSRFWRMKIRWVESGNTRLLITATVVSKPSIGRRKTQTQLHRCANKVCKFINGKLTPAWHPKPEQGHEIVFLPGGRAECQNFIFREGLHPFRASQSKCSPPTHPPPHPTGIHMEKAVLENRKSSSRFQNLPYKYCFCLPFKHITNPFQYSYFRSSTYKRKEFVLGYLVASL